MVAHASQLDLLLPARLADALAAQGARAWPRGMRGAMPTAEILNVKHLHRALGNELVGALVAHRRPINDNLGHEAVRRRGHRRPLGMRARNALFGKHFNLDALPRAQLGDENIFVRGAHRLCREPIDLVHECVKRQWKRQS